VGSKSASTSACVQELWRERSLELVNQGVVEHDFWKGALGSWERDEVRDRLVKLSLKMGMIERKRSFGLRETLLHLEMTAIYT